MNTALLQADSVQARQIQEQTIGLTKEELGSAAVVEGNQYAWKHADHIYNMADDYSCDLFTDDTIPFAQIALHDQP
ncbi:MAG: hypothetical protein K0Q73_2304 [Paenibacillus sp.]|jgi:hypothetical protein|nr:hypothetical protein [Paenibacillus sp.]